MRAELASLLLPEATLQVVTRHFLAALLPAHREDFPAPVPVGHAAHQTCCNLTLGLEPLQLTSESAAADLSARRISTS